MECAKGLPNEIPVTGMLMKDACGIPMECQWNADKMVIKYQKMPLKWLRNAVGMPNKYQ